MIKIWKSVPDTIDATDRRTKTKQLKKKNLSIYSKIRHGSSGSVYMHISNGTGVVALSPLWRCVWLNEWVTAEFYFPSTRTCSMRNFWCFPHADSQFVTWKSFISQSGSLLNTFWTLIASSYLQKKANWGIWYWTILPIHCQWGGK